MLNVRSLYCTRCARWAPAGRSAVPAFVLFFFSAFLFGKESDNWNVAVHVFSSSILVTRRQLFNRGPSSLLLSYNVLPLLVHTVFAFRPLHFSSVPCNEFLTSRGAKARRPMLLPGAPHVVWPISVSCHGLFGTSSAGDEYFRTLILGEVYTRFACYKHRYRVRPF